MKDRAFYRVASDVLRFEKKIKNPAGRARFHGLGTAALCALLCGAPSLTGARGATPEPPSAGTPPSAPGTSGPGKTPPPQAAPGAGSAQEARINALLASIDEQARAEKWERAEALIHEIASIDPDHPKAYFRAVMLQKDRGQIDKAAALMDSLGPKDGPGRTYGNALASFMTGHIEDATSGFSKALEMYEARGHVAGQAASHFALGNIGSRARDYGGAARHFDAASRLLGQLGDRAGAADLLLAKADALVGNKRAAEGVESARQAIEIRKVIGSNRDLAKAYNVLGRCQRAQDLYEDALGSYRQSLELRRQEGDRPGEAATLSEIARLYQDMGRLEDAVDQQKKGVAAAEGLNDKTELARQHRVLADILVAADKPREATGSFETSAALYHEAKNPLNEGRSLAALGDTWISLSELRRARSAYEPALVQAHAARDVGGEAHVLTGLGNLALASDDLARGLFYQQEALPLFRQVEDRPGELSVLNNLSFAYLMLGDRSQARSYIDLALAAATKSSSRRGEAQARGNLAVLLSAEGSYAPALEAASRAEALWKEAGDERRSAISRANSAELLLRLGRTGEVAAPLRSALAVFEKTGDAENESYVHNMLGELLLEQGSTTGAMAEQRKALDLAQQVDSPRCERRAYAGLASVLERQGKRQEAVGEIMKALDAVERVRSRLVTSDLKMRFLSERMDLYEQAVTLTLPARPRGASPSAKVIRGRDVAAAFRIVERARARSLLDALAPPSRGSSGSATAEQEKSRNESRDDLGEAMARLADARTRADRAAARSRVESARARAEKLDIAMGIESGGDNAGSRQAGPLELATVQQRVLRSDEGMLEYFIGNSRAWVFTITKQDASVREIPAAQALADRAEAFFATASRASAGAGGNTSEKKAAEDLAVVLMPAGPPPASRLLVVPDGPLRHVPFEALRSGGKYLIETHEVAIVPSATTLALLRGVGSDMRPRSAPRDTKGFLGVADPVAAEGGDKLPPLPFARREVEEIAELFPEGDRKLLVGADATRSKVLAAQPGSARFVHFAAHAWLDPESPRNTGLRLGVEKPGAEGTLLGVDDIQSLSLSADLVVVSACSSAQGETLRGEGLSGLTRAFLNAGSRAVVVTLWDIPDRSTADFMRDFYEGVTHGQSAAAALRASKLRFLSSNVTGRDRLLRWAPFILVGDPGKGTSASNPSTMGATATTH